MSCLLLKWDKSGVSPPLSCSVHTGKISLYCYSVEWVSAELDSQCVGLIMFIFIWEHSSHFTDIQNQCELSVPLLWMRACPATVSYNIGTCSTKGAWAIFVRNVVIVCLEVMCTIDAGYKNRRVWLNTEKKLYPMGCISSKKSLRVLVNEWALICLYYYHLL